MRCPKAPWNGPQEMLNALMVFQNWVFNSSLWPPECKGHCAPPRATREPSEQQKPNSKVQYVLEAAFNLQQAPKTWEDKLHKKCLNLHNSTGKKMFIWVPQFCPCEKTSVTRRRPSQIKALKVVPTNEGQHHCNGFDNNALAKWTPPWRLQHLRIPLNMHLRREFMLAYFVEESEMKRRHRYIDDMYLQYHISMYWDDAGYVCKYIYICIYINLHVYV